MLAGLRTAPPKNTVDVEKEEEEEKEGDPNCSLSLYLTLSLQRSLHASERAAKERAQRKGFEKRRFIFLPLSTEEN